MHLDRHIHSLDCRQVDAGGVTFVRYTAIGRQRSNEPGIPGLEHPFEYGAAREISGGHAACVAPGQWVWIGRGEADPPNPSDHFVATDFSPSVVTFECELDFFGRLVSHHAPAAMDCDLLSPGFRRFRFERFSLETLVLPDAECLVLTPRGHAHTFASIVLTHSDAERRRLP